MPPLKALKTDEEAAAIPLSQPILIELPGMDLGGDDEPAGKVADTGNTDNGAKTLQEQLEALQAATAATNDRAARAEADAAQARREAQERTREVEEARTHASTLEKDIISGGLSAAQGELAAAESELERAGEAGDFKAMAKAQTRIGRASAQIVNLEGGAAEAAERVERKPQAQQQQERQNPDPIAGIDANPNLFPAEKDWLKAHPDAVTDTRRNNELGVGYERAMKQGLTRGTPDYFAFLEDFMGYAKGSTTNTNNDGSSSVQAPPSRNERGGDGRPNANRITLSAEQREIAKNMGVTDIEYARQVMNFEADKKANPEKYGLR